MLMLLCVQVVETNNNEFSPREKKKWFSNANKQKIYELVKKTKKNYLKNLVDKIHKLIVKELKLNVNCHIKIDKNHNLLPI
jgi:transposase